MGKKKKEKGRRKKEKGKLKKRKKGEKWPSLFPGSSGHCKDTGMGTSLAFSHCRKPLQVTLSRIKRKKIPHHSHGTERFSGDSSVS